MSKSARPNNVRPNKAQLWLKKTLPWLWSDDSISKHIRYGSALVAILVFGLGGWAAMAIIDVDPNVAPAIAALVASSDGIQNVRAQRLFTMDEVMAVRQMRARLQASYRPPGQ